MHPNCVQFLGLHSTESGDYYIVTEYLSKGSLASLVRQLDELSIKDKLSLAIGTAKGMAYLENQKVIHRDLSARNILVERKDDKYVAKVADFGMSRITDKGEYIASSGTLPIKWSAPEVLRRDAATSKSDVWSFGIVLWELWERGAEPYGWLSNREAYERVLDGEVLEPSKKMPPAIADLMKKCLKMNPSERPSFFDIVNMLKSISKQLVKKSSEETPEQAAEDAPNTMKSANYDTTPNFVHTPSSNSNASVENPGYGTEKAVASYKELNLEALVPVSNSTTKGYDNLPIREVDD